ncbi:hypothetical protein ACX40Y_03900 [Sphingomonas sp. RS6]
MNALALFVGSLAAVLALAWTARRLGLGGGTIASAVAACEAAEAHFADFAATRAWLSADHGSAVITGADDSVVLLRVHGAGIVARRASPPLAPRSDGRTIVLAPDEPFAPAFAITLETGAEAALLTSLLAKQAPHV